ncbi:D-3-phosphoglycerate dehydrogenase [hydrothermal vent metagenome]|uniref:D-3-phosphoglycerate dehydrogenase n=1 Tax=hydrothermal vent metagenome TaxID=652676 RepID=A0A3B0U753_9ZZZZ
MLLLHLQEVDEKLWAKRLGKLLGNYKIVTRDDDFNPDDIRYVFVWKPRENAFDGLNNLKAVLCLGAGVDALLTHPSLPKSVPIVRYANNDLTRCMSDYVIANVTMHHRGFSRFKNDQIKREWNQYYPPPSWDISVGIMGLGVLGADAARQLKSMGYQVNGWSRSAKNIEGITEFFGPDQLNSFLEQTDIAVNLLPLTPETSGILNYENFTKLRRDILQDGPAIINAARGGHQNEVDIEKALKDGTLGAASLDVFNIEPLPKDSALWRLQNCYITPHIAAISSPENGASYFARVIRDHENGLELINLVDMDCGY